MFIPLGGGQFLHLESGAVIQDTPTTQTLTITYGTTVFTVPTQFYSRVRRQLQMAAEIAPTPPASALTAIGADNWTPDRAGM